MRRVHVNTVREHRVQTDRGLVARPGRRTSRMCTGTPVHHEQTVRERVVMPGRRMRRACTDTLVYFVQTFSSLM